MSSDVCYAWGGRPKSSGLKSVVVARAGNLSVADHLAQMRTWLADRNIVPRELVMLHVLNLRLVFRADGDADLFAQTFGNHQPHPL
jgi:hypothetical protein